jgi:hypothetical protein
MCKPAAVEDQLWSRRAGIGLRDRVVRQRAGLERVLLAQKRGGPLDQSNRLGHLRDAQGAGADAQHEERTIDRDQNQRAGGNSSHLECRLALRRAE